MRGLLRVNPIVPMQNLFLARVRKMADIRNKSNIINNNLTTTATIKLTKAAATNRQQQRKQQ